MTLKIAIVGAGPSGFYMAEALLAGGGVEIDLVEKLPTPFGLVRAGVAPDHQHTKRVTQAFEKTALAPAVAYFGNVELGRSLSLEELRGLYDAVVLALGAPVDRQLGLPGEELRGVLGSAAFVGWYNGHPEFQQVEPPLEGPRAVVIGNGNVALDVARVLMKTPAEMAASDISPEVEAAIAAWSPGEVVILGRRGPAEAKFTPQELREFLALESALPVVEGVDLTRRDAGQGDTKEARRGERTLEIFRSFSSLPRAGRDRRLRFVFHAAPFAFEGDADGRLTAVLAHPTELDASGSLRERAEILRLPCRLAIKAVGYRAQTLGGLSFDETRGAFANEGGSIARGLYCVGWCRRGPSGVIGSSKADAQEVTAKLRAQTTAGRPGRTALEALLRGRNLRWVDYPEWQQLDEAEQAAAQGPAPRRKLVTREDMLALLPPRR